MRALALPLDDLLIFGSGPLLAHGLIASVGDIDLLARGEAWRRASRLGEQERGPGGDRIVKLGAVDIFDGWMDLNVGELMARRQWLHGLPWGDLRDVLAFKQRLGRPKDQAHIQLLLEHLG